MPLALRYAARSDIGLVRTGNEDSGYAGPRLLAVADGMGGHAAGEVASTVVLSALAPLDDDDSAGDLLDALATAVSAAQVDLGRAVDTQPELEGMGTTLTALLWSGNRVGLAHVGDSRAYLLRGGELVRLTHDHTYVQSLVDSGRITADEAATHPRRSLLTRALGNGSDTEPDLSIRETREGDRFLLCSDGLSAVVSESTIHDALADTTPGSAVDRLVELALRGGGPDNITAIVADVIDLDTAAADVAAHTDSIVVGAAGAEGSTGPSLRTAAGRAAAALRPVTDVAGPADPDPARSEAQRARRRRRLQLGIAGALVAVVAIAAVAAFGAWTRTQYFVGTYGGQVAIYRGIPQDVLGLDLSDVYEVQQIDLVSLSPAQQADVADTIHASDLARARAIVETLAAGDCAGSTDPACDQDDELPLPGATPTSSAGSTADPSAGATTPTQATTPTATPTLPGVVLTTEAGAT